MKPKTDKISKTYKIRGHHLKCLKRFVWDYGKYPDGEKLYLKSDTREKDGSYSKELVKNEVKIWKRFLSGRCRIKLIKTLDDICLGGGCYIRSGKGYPGEGPSCRGPILAREDVETAAKFGLEIGKTYTYEEIKPHIHKYLIEHHHEPDIEFLREVLRIK